MPYVKSGLKQGEVVVVDGVQNVKPGAVVTDAPANAAPGAQPAAGAVKK